MEWITDEGAQYVTNTSIEYLNAARNLKFEAKTYSKEENSIVERLNNRSQSSFMENYRFDTRVIDSWIDYIPIMEKLFNSSLNASTGVSLNLIIMGKIRTFGSKENYFLTSYRFPQLL